jgi:hypothetical protein
VAENAGVAGWWIALTRFLAIYQLFTGLLSAAAFLSAQAALNNAALALAIIGLPLFTLVWVAGMLHEIKHGAAA